eukprot:scaffold2482_cov166-Amphora_coffeaeformis.AAC.23
MSQPKPESSPLDASSDDSLSGLDLGSSGSTTHRQSTSNRDPYSPSGEVDHGLAIKETTRIKNLRSILITVLIVVATGTSVGLFFFTRSNERKEFEAAFEGHGMKLIGGFQQDSQRKVQALDSLSSRLTAFALDTNASWPFVTVSHSSELFEPYRQLADAAAVQLMPIVQPRQRAEWEDYAIANQGWIEESLAEQGRATTAKDRTLQGITPYIKNYVGIDTTPGRWIVWWQYAPVIPDRYFVNFNRLAWNGFDFEAQAVEEQKAVISTTLNFQPGLDFQSTRDFNFMDELLSAGGSGDYKPGEPIAYLHYPVFDTFEDETKKTVAIASATVYWRSFFQHILPENVEGFYCVVTSSLGQVFTYRIDGQEAIFLGMEDLHETKYDKYVLMAEYSDFQSSEATKDGYTGVKIDNSYVTYSVKVYPSRDLEGEYVTMGPYLYAGLLFFIFLFTTGIFLLYNLFVEKRQQIVLDTAVKTTAVVKSLFPANVRDRLIEEAGMNTGAEMKAHPFMNRGDRENEKSSKPIADFFPETTILFADMVGFTAWSSVREPAQVFSLLEAVYSAFDEIAKRRGVFKVETVGDCYVAGKLPRFFVGLPRPRSDHAVVMARFASDCLRKLDSMTTQLELDLGAGTSDLTMRMGLHSGAVTAGVLRGDNARFQLFGDTVNTASRMESTGVPERIQVSEDTAELLRKAGKESWLVERSGGVFAKGKGKIKTYFVNVGSSTSAGSSHCSEHSREAPKTKDRLTTYDMFYLEEETDYNVKIDRMIKWNFEVLRKSLKQIVARRKMTKENAQHTSKSQLQLTRENQTGNALGEIAEIITLPRFDRTLRADEVSPEDVDLESAVEDQLMELIMVIARMYHRNPFHNFKVRNKGETNKDAVATKR